MTQVGVTLTDWDLAVCELTAKQRTEHWQVSTRQTNFDENFYGCKGEMALAKALNVRWQGMDSLLEVDREGDVGDYQVKSTIHKDGHLIFQEQHRIGKKTVLAIVGINKIRLAGWLHFDNAKSMVNNGIGRKEWRNHLHETMTWWIPQTNLESMDWLPVIYGREVVKL
jgi:hypothetical protein